MSNRWRNYKAPLTPEELRDAYSSGMTQVEIAAKFSTTPRVVRYAMRKHGVKARVAAKRNQQGPLNSGWKGDGAGYAALHGRVIAAKGRPCECERCGTCDPGKQYHWANISGRYEDVSDYQRMCRSCHSKYDGLILNVRPVCETVAPQRARGARQFQQKNKGESLATTYRQSNP